MCSVLNTSVIRALLEEDQSRFLDKFCVIIIIAILDHADVLIRFLCCNSGRVPKLFSFLFFTSKDMFSSIFNGSRLLFTITCLMPKMLRSFRHRIAIVFVLPIVLTTW